ncbi:glutamate racemase [Calditerrivibrio nitroreducens]|uniref:Glutamate racemase n=1 Tax=Calditerrivibrio nitroreducens (strain DSM 19672 / NBRC 101217 / Yu37-1) TaxID=768670 RepID=E4TIX6_CALNY|nr:glutamate racemase [Calditerrivibrio nitroreducens]ADR19108.1 glutamate racemase [Calditerrivibrio nitroreducens DSM 19672]
MSIGVFDSGVGGLTVFKSIADRFKTVDIYYVGDTARVPYGNKSRDTIVKYSLELTEFLVKSFAVDLVVVACNTASSYALDFLKNRYNIPIIGVVEPGCIAAINATKNGKIGVIGTQATINSNSYANTLSALTGGGVRVYQKGCPLLVPLVEEGKIEHPVTKIILKEYLDGIVSEGIDTLILGCTHYPVLKDVINSIYPELNLVDSSVAIIDYIHKLNLDLNEKGLRNLFVTDESVSFENLKKLIIGDIPTFKVNLDSIELK